MVAGERSGQYGLGDPGPIFVKLGQITAPIHVIVTHREPPFAVPSDA
jgi:hypothetical protein